MLREVTNEDFNNKCSMKINNVLQGLSDYSNNTIKFNFQDEFLLYVQEKYRENNNSVIIDFYFNKLTDNTFDILLNSVSCESKKVLKEFKKYLSSPCIYYEIQDELVLTALVELNLKEIFFVNFYFNLIEEILWPSFKGEVINFRKQLQKSLYK